LNYCSGCGSALTLKVPSGDNRDRHVCDICGAIHYQNPRVVVGCIPEWERQVLLCRRAIEPRAGFWTLPAGFLEMDESTEQGAARETYEEAVAQVEIIAPYSLFSVPHIGQVHLFFRARMLTSEFAAGEESLEVALFDESRIPWEELAFPTVRETLRRYFEDRTRGCWQMHSATLQPGAGRTTRGRRLKPS